MPDLTDAQVKALQATAATDRGAYICRKCGPVPPIYSGSGLGFTCGECGRVLISPEDIEGWGYHRTPTPDGIPTAPVRALLDTLRMRDARELWPSVAPLMDDLDSLLGGHKSKAEVENEELRSTNKGLRVKLTTERNKHEIAADALKHHRDALRDALAWPKGQQSSWYNLLEAVRINARTVDKLRRQVVGLRDQIATGSRANIYTVLMEAARSIDAAFDELDPDGEIGRRLRAG